MSEPEIIRLKKENHRLRELNNNLKIQVDEQAVKIGELQSSHLNLKNKSLILEENKLKQQREDIKFRIEEEIFNQQQKVNEMAQENNLLKDKLKMAEEKIRNNEDYIQKLQLENNENKRKLIEYSKKSEAKDWLKRVDDRDKLINEKNVEYQKLVKDWNELRDKMEEVLSENRILRQIADVPENFGIDLTEVKMGDRVKIEDYKAKIRILQKEIDDLESERARLKHQLQFLANTLNITEPPFSMLTKEQKVEVAKYAQSLYEGTDFIQPERYDLINQNRQLKEKIKSLEEELSNQRFNGKLGIDVNHIGSNERNVNQNELKKLLNEQKEDIIKTFMNTIGSQNSQNTFVIESGDKLRTTNPKKKFAQTEDEDTKEFNILQLPPVPLFSGPNPDNITAAASYRFDTKFRIAPSKIHELFGIALNENDPDALKNESAALQCQIIELLEIESRRNKNDENLHNNLKSIYDKLESLVMIQNEIFERYMNDKEKNKSEIEKSKVNLKNILSECESLKRINKAYEETINNLNSKNLSEIERKMIEKLKENAILENNNNKLMRKYDCLFEDNKKLEEFVENNNKLNDEKFTNLKKAITKLKAMKKLLMFYVKLLNNKLRKSVDLNLFETISNENKFLRRKINELNSKDLDITKQMIQSQNIILKYKDLENSFYLCEEAKFDAEIENHYFKKRLSDLDPNFYNQQKAFRKLIYNFEKLNLSNVQIRNGLIGNLHSENNENNENNNEKSFEKTLGRNLNFLNGLTMDNSYITKSEFENALINFGINDMTPADLKFIYQELNCEIDEKIDVRLLLKKLSSSSVEPSVSMNTSDEEIFKKLITAISNSSVNLQSVFEYFDTNNNGCITREEFKFALNQLKCNLNDVEIDKLVFIVSGKNEFENDLNENDVFNYLEFCDLFEQKSKNFLLKTKKNSVIKNNVKIDSRFNYLSKILEGLKQKNLQILESFELLHKSSNDFLDKTELAFYINSLDVNMSDEEVAKLFACFDSGRNALPVSALVLALNSTKNALEDYQMKALNTTQEKIDIHKKYYILLEEKNYFEIKINSFQKRLNELEKSNGDLNNQLKTYSEKNKEIVDKYFSLIAELQNVKDEFVTSGIKKTDLLNLEHRNDSLEREVVILRIGLNTFKELYNSANFQIKNMNLNNVKDRDEIDTYKKAVKELQSLDNKNALIGKLYYTILIARWREGNNLKNYDAFLQDLSDFKESNFNLETNNKNLIKDLNEINLNLHDQFIENIKLNHEIDNLKSGFGDNIEEKFVYFDEYKNLISSLSNEKKNLIKEILRLKKNVLNLEIENDQIKNKVDFAEKLRKNIEFSNSDEYSKKLINLNENYNKLNLNFNKLKRENNFEKENANYLKKLNDDLTNELNQTELKNIDLNNKFVKLEQTYQKKDEERTKKIIDALNKMKKFDNQEISEIQSDINIKPESTEFDSKLKSSPPNVEILQNKINELNNVIKKKNDEIIELQAINTENANILKQNKDFYDRNAIPNLVGESGYKIIQDDETKRIAQISHKTIKTLQDLLNQKNELIAKKEKQIFELNSQLNKQKLDSLNKINSLEDEIKDGHNKALKKIQNIIDNTNANLITKYTKNDLALLTLNDLEKMINDKDNAIKALAIELKAIKEENELNYNILNEKNRKINDLENDLQDQKFSNNLRANEEIIHNLKTQLELKNIQIQEEKEKIEKLKSDFTHKFQDKILNDDDNRLDNTAKVPEHLIVNKEKSDLYVKIDQLRKKNNKLIEEKKKLNEKINELNMINNKLNEKLQKTKGDYSDILDLQKKDTKRISTLKKEKDKLKENNDKLKEEIEKLNNQITNLQINNNNNNNNNNNINNFYNNNLRSRPNSNFNSRVPLPESSNSNFLPNINNNSNNNSFNISVNSNLNNLNSKFKSSNISNEIDGNKIVDDLIYYILNKNINIENHLQRYDVARNNKISVKDFKNAIDELKIGFIDTKVEALVKVCEPEGNFINLEKFITMLENKNPTFKNFINEKRKINFSSNKNNSKKYSSFENKDYNIGY